MGGGFSGLLGLIGFLGWKCKAVCFNLGLVKGWFWFGFGLVPGLVWVGVVWF